MSDPKATEKLIDTIANNLPCSKEELYTMILSSKRGSSTYDWIKSMGLGPPVCEKCMVLAEYDNDRVDLGKNPWHCSICNNDDPKYSLWSCGWTQQELEDNKHFLRFAKGEPPENK